VRLPAENDKAQRYLIVVNPCQNFTFARKIDVLAGNDLERRFVSVRICGTGQVQVTESDQCAGPMQGIFEVWFRNPLFVR